MAFLSLRLKHFVLLCTCGPLDTYDISDIIIIFNVMLFIVITAVGLVKLVYVTTIKLGLCTYFRRFLF